MALIAAHLNAGVIPGDDSVAIGIYSPPPPYTLLGPVPNPLMVSVDVRHHVCLLTSRAHFGSKCFIIALEQR